MTRALIPTVYTPAMLAERWECSEQYVLRQVRGGKLTSFKLGKLFRFRTEAVEKFEETYGMPKKRGGCDVYVIRCGVYVKIGKAANVTRRIAGMRAHIPFDIELVAVLAEGDGHQLELDLHKRFAEHRDRGEWFRFNGSLARWVAEGCPT